MTFHGRASHAGMYPEEGRSAIAAAARAIADLRLGRIDEETTANVGVIVGGERANIVPERCTFERRGAFAGRAEARRARPGDARRDHVRRRRRASAGRDVESRSYRGYRFRGDDGRAARRARRSGAVGVTRPTFALSGGARGREIFNERGLQCVNLANGMSDIHTPDERIAVADLERMVDVTLALVDAALA